MLHGMGHVTASRTYECYALDNTPDLEPYFYTGKLSDGVGWPYRKTERFVYLWDTIV